MKTRPWKLKMYVKRRLKMLEQSNLDIIEPLVTLILIEIEGKQLHSPKEIVEHIKRKCNSRDLFAEIMLQVISNLPNKRRDILIYLKKEDRNLFVKVITM